MGLDPITPDPITPYRRYMAYNVLGTLPWVGGFAFAGYYFGNIPAIKRNFQYVVIAIIVISVMPAIIGYIKERRRPA